MYVTSGDQSIGYGNYLVIYCQFITKKLQTLDLGFEDNGESLL